MGKYAEELRPALDEGQWLRLLHAGRLLSRYTVWSHEMATDVLARAILASNRPPSEALYQAVRKVSGREPWDFDGTSMAWLASIPAPPSRPVLLPNPPQPPMPLRRACCVSVETEPHLVTCRAVVHLCEPQVNEVLRSADYGTDEDQRVYREARKLGEYGHVYEHQSEPLWHDKRADDSKGVSYRLPWIVRVWGRIRFWLKL